MSLTLTEETGRAWVNRSPATEGQIVSTLWARRADFIESWLWSKPARCPLAGKRRNSVGMRQALLLTTKQYVC